MTTDHSSTSQNVDTEKQEIDLDMQLPEDLLRRKYLIKKTRLTLTTTQLDLDITWANKKARGQLMCLLIFVSIIWLFFTGYIVFHLTFRECHLSDIVATAFITTSLATVLGLWLVGLRYFFSTKI